MAVIEANLCANSHTCYYSEQLSEAQSPFVCVYHIVLIYYLHATVEYVG